MLTEKQKQERLKGIGGSDVADVLSLPPYGCARKLWYEKRQAKPDFEPVTSNDMLRGVYLESIAIKVYKEKTGNAVLPPQKFNSEEYPFILGNVDGLISRTDEDEDPGVIEVKCPSRDNYLRIKRLGIPDYYITQGQHYMFIADKKWMEYAVFCADLWEILPIAVDRDDELIEELITQEEIFWKKVENGPSPEKLEWGDKRCKSCIYRLTCWDNEWQEPGDEVSEADDYEESEDTEFIEACREHGEAKQLYKQAEELLYNTKNKIIEIVGDKQKVKCNYGKVNYSWGKRKLINTTKLKEEMPDIAAKYQYDSISRSFRFYKNKNIKGGDNLTNMIMDNSTILKLKEEKQNT